MSGIPIPLFWVCGPPGVGKTAAAWALHERLTDAGRAPAYVDVDQLGICYPAPADDPHRHRLQARNVAALRASFAAARARGLIVSGVVDADHGPPVDLLGGGDVTVCRLRADPDELVARLTGRAGTTDPDPATALREAERLDRSSFATRGLDTTDLPAPEVAARLARWLGNWPDRLAGTPGRPGDGPGPGRLLWLSGPTGVGKSTIGFGVYLRVLRSGVRAAYLDVDQLGFHGTGPPDHALRARHVAALAANFRAAGAEALVVVGPVADPGQAAVYERALPATVFTWCRLHVGPDELTRRILTRRDGGSWPQPGDPLVGRPVAELRAVAARAVADARALEHHGPGLQIAVDGLTLTQAADLVLAHTAWAPDPHP